MPCAERLSGVFLQQRDGEYYLPENVSPQADAGSLTAASQTNQPKALDLFVIADSFRRMEGPLAASSQMLRDTIPKVRVDLAEANARVPEVEIFPQPFRCRWRPSISCGIGFAHCR
jgi:hypothetical protein